MPVHLYYIVTVHGLKQVWNFVLRKIYKEIVNVVVCVGNAYSNVVATMTHLYIFIFIYVCCSFLYFFREFWSTTAGHFLTEAHKWKGDDFHRKIIRLCFTTESVLDFETLMPKWAQSFYSSISKSFENATKESNCFSVQSCCTKKKGLTRLFISKYEQRLPVLAAGAVVKHTERGKSDTSASQAGFVMVRVNYSFSLGFYKFIFWHRLSWVYLPLCSVSTTILRVGEGGDIVKLRYGIKLLFKKKSELWHVVIISCYVVG